MIIIIRISNKLNNVCQLLTKTIRLQFHVSFTNGDDAGDDADDADDDDDDADDDD